MRLVQNSTVPSTSFNILQPLYPLLIKHCLLDNAHRTVRWFPMTGLYGESENLDECMGEDTSWGCWKSHRTPPRFAGKTARDFARNPLTLGCGWQPVWLGSSLENHNRWGSGDLFSFWFTWKLTQGPKDGHFRRTLFFHSSIFIGILQIPGKFSLSFPQTRLFIRPKMGRKGRWNLWLKHPSHFLAYRRW